MVHYKVYLWTFNMNVYALNIRNNSMDWLFPIFYPEFS